MLPDAPVNTEVPLEHEMLIILQELSFKQALLTRLMIETGQRPGEAKRLKWDAIDLDRKVLRAGVIDGESLATDLLKQLRSTNMAWVFSHRDGLGKPMNNYRKLLKSAVKQSGVQRYCKPIKFTRKYARKAFTSYQYLRGVSLTSIKRFVGHSPQSRVIEINYLHIPESSLCNTVFERSVEGKPE